MLATGAHKRPMWLPISTAPFDRDLELAVHDKDGYHALVFPYRRIPGGWVKADSKGIDVHPTHWRECVERVTEEPDRQTILNLLPEEQQKQRDPGDPIQFAW